MHYDKRERRVFTHHHTHCACDRSILAPFGVALRGRIGVTQRPVCGDSYEGVWSWISGRRRLNTYAGRITQLKCQSTLVYHGALFAGALLDIQISHATAYSPTGVHGTHG